MILVSAVFALVAMLGFYIYKMYEPYFETMKYTKHRSGVTKVLLSLNLNNAYRKLTDYMTGYDTCFAGPFFVQVVRDPEDLKIVLNSEEAYEKTLFSGFFYRYGLLTEGGDVYKHQRKVLSPLFSSTRLRYITPIINQNMTDFLKLFENMRKPEEVDFKHIATYFSTSSSLYTVFNIDITDYDLLSKIIENTRLTILKCTERIIRPWMYSHTIFEHTKLGREIRKLKKENFKLQTLDKLTETAEEPNNNNNDNNNNMDMKIEGLKFFKDYAKKLDLDPKSIEYLEGILVFVGASYETTADVLANTLLLLAMNPDKQDILVDEIKAVLNNDGEFVTEEQSEQMPYLDLVIKEGLRLLPAAVVIGRKVTKDLKLTRYTAKAGSFIMMPLLDVHLDKKLWGEDALEFKPERFSEENIEKVHPYAYFPFSKGPRICPGYKHSILTMKIFLSRFLMTYRVSTHLKYEELVIRFGMTLHIKQRPMIKVDFRNE